MPKTVSSFHLSRAMSLAPDRTPSTSSSTFSLFQVSKGCSHPEIPAQIDGNAEVTDVLIQNLSQVMSPTGSSTTRSLIKQEDITCTEDNQITEIEGRVTTLSYNQSLCMLRLKKQTWTTNIFVLCWLHHGTYRSEKQVRNDRKFNTLKKKA